MFLRLLIALWCAVLFCAPAQAVEGKRIALVIGNDAYQKVTPLRKAGNDATSMARELKAAGFEVLLHKDLNYRGMVKAVETFSNSITGGDQVVVFFAGHGVQIRSGSYLLPVDIEANSESEIEKTSYGLTDLTDKLSEAKASFALILVDACRDNPIKNNGRSVGGTRGLSPIDPPKGQMVVFSASRGQQALDSLSDADRNPNGVFTREFIKRMKQPGVRVEDMVREVQDSVEALARTVSHEQRPAMYSEARGNFYFFGPTTVQVQGGNQVADPESETWTAAERANSVLGYQTYLDTFPKGRYAAAAKIAISALKQPAAQILAPTKPNPAAGADPETAFWNEVKASGAREYLDAYLKQYPKGKFLALAKLELRKLDDKDKTERERQTALRNQEEQTAWDSAKSAGTQADYTGYLGSYPSGQFAALARAAQQRLKREAEDDQRQSAQRLAVQQRKQREDSERAVKEPRTGRTLIDCSDCPEMVVILAGSFLMGSNDGFADQKPIHSVTLKSFALGKFEVTRGQFAAFVTASGHNAGKSCRTLTGDKWDDMPERNWRRPGFSQTDEDPVTCVNWDDAQAYVSWLSQKTGKSYRLPSEAEWEYACRGGVNQAYCGSDNVDSVAVYGRQNGDKTLPVGGRQSNAWGLYDMSGNVWEWVQDCRNDNYNGAPTDGSSWTTGSCGQRILRGGSWNLYPTSAHPAYRIMSEAANRNGDYGFRLARTLP